MAEELFWTVKAALETNNVTVNGKTFNPRSRPTGFLHSFKKAIYAIDSTTIQLGLFGAHTLVRTWRKTEHLAGKLRGTTSKEASYHVSSVRIDARHNARFFADWVRGEWSVEKHHARRDGTYCEDIRTRRRDENVTGALMLARTLALYFFAKSGMSNCQAFKEKMQANPDMAFDRVMGKEV